jgi:hypothetical protein
MSVLHDTTPALVRLGSDAERAGMRVVRSTGFFDIELSRGLDTEGRPLWGARIHLTDRNTFLVAKHFVGPHVTTVHTIGEIRTLLFEPHDS